MQIIQALTIKHFLAILLVFTVFLVSTIQNSYSGTISRDQEIEDFFDDILGGFLENNTQFVKSSQISTYIYNDNSLNAFVVNGMNIFMNYGLLKFFENFDVIAGILAHELAHIYEGHIARGMNHRSSVTNNLMKVGMGVILGLAISTNAETSMAATSVLSEILRGNSYQFSRDIEREADIQSTKFIETIGGSLNGAIDFFTYMINIHDVNHSNNHMSTHPNSRERISYLKTLSKTLPSKLSDEYIYFQNYYTIIRYKLLCMTDVKYCESEKNKVHQNYSKYAKAIALYKNKDFANAILAVEEILTIASYSKLKPYLLELLGQIYYDSSYNKDVTISANYYRESLTLIPNASLIKLQFVNASLLNVDNLSVSEKNYLLTILEILSIREANDAFFIRKIAEAYYKLEHILFSHLYMIKYFVITEEFSKAEEFLVKAKKKACKADECNLLFNMEEFLKNALNNPDE